MANSCQFQIGLCKYLNFAAKFAVRIIKLYRMMCAVGHYELDLLALLLLCVLCQ
jgi:hypothetical protein